MRKTFCMLVTLVGFGSGETGAAAVPGGPPRTLHNPQPGVGDDFGRSIAVLGKNVLVGAPSDDTGATDAGIVYLMDGATGQLLRTIRNPEPDAGDHFGWSLAVAGGNVLVGAFADDGGVGAAHLFEGSTGKLLRTFRNPEPNQGDLFGRTVSSLADKVIVGACADDDNAGAVYVFDLRAEKPLKIANPRPSAGDRFGLALATGNGNIFVGAYGEDSAGENAGAAYLFEGTTGRLLRTYENPEPASGGELGISLAVAGDNVLVGAGRYDKDVGIAYLLEGSSGKLLQTFRNPTPEGGDFFGIPVAVAGGRVVVSAPRDQANGNAGGALYVFEAATGTLLRTIANPTPQGEDYFGVPIVPVGRNLLVGAPSDDATLTDAGTVYLFENVFDSP